MSRLAGLIVLSALAIPAAASHPTRARQEKPRPTQSAEPPLAVPVPIPPAGPAATAGDRVLMTVLCPDRALIRFVTDQVSRSLAARLPDESEELRQARDEFHRFWMNNQPGVLTYKRLAGAVGP
jgi:hypothetical protein